MSERTCSKCGVTKPETVEFFRKRGTKDRGGLRPDCRTCSTARDRAYYQAIPASVRQARREPSRDAIRAWQRSWATALYATPEGKARLDRAHRKWGGSPAGRERLRQLQQIRRARKRELDATLTAGEWQACLEWFGNCCAYCGADGGGKLTQDHVVAVTRGGHYSAGNIVPACLSCNSGKHRSLVEVWYPSKQFYCAGRMALIVDYLAEAS